MKRVEYYNYIDERLALLALRVEKRGKLNILDYHIHSEFFYRDLFNILYGYRLDNVNTTNQNVEAIDLIDKNAKVIIQVSATNKVAKIKSSLSKCSEDLYNGYSFKFISIAKTAKNLRNKSYSTPNSISFTPDDDIYDLDSILRDIQGFEIDKLCTLHEFIEKELGRETPQLKLNSHLTTIINILSKDALTTYELPNPVCFQIEEKVEYNKLSTYKQLVADYLLYHKTISEIYSTYDSMGKNKSLSVLNSIRKLYIENKANLDGDDLFKAIIIGVKQKITDSKNFEPMAEEELDMCIDILIVDAFIKCKIFKNPENYDVTT